MALIWKKVDPKQGEVFSKDKGSDLERILNNSFGKLPFTLQEKHLERLNGICTCGHPDIYILIKAIKEFGTIHIDSNYNLSETKGLSV